MHVDSHACNCHMLSTLTSYRIIHMKDIFQHEKRVQRKVSCIVCVICMLMGFKWEPHAVRTANKRRWNEEVRNGSEIWNFHQNVCLLSFFFFLCCSCLVHNCKQCSTACRMAWVENVKEQTCYSFEHVLWTDGWKMNGK